MKEFTVQFQSIGIIRSPFDRPAGTPIQPAFSKGALGQVEIFEEYARGLKDLDGFDRIWLLYVFNRCPAYKLHVMPYMDTQARGVFATRAPARPNAIGISPVILDRIEGNILFVRDIDVLDQTPLLDIKPYSPKFDCFTVEREGWLGQADTRRSRADERFHKE